MATLNFVVQYGNGKLGRIADLRQEYTNNNLIHLSDDLIVDYEGKKVVFKAEFVSYLKSKKEAEDLVNDLNDLFKRQGDKIQESFNWRY